MSEENQMGGYLILTQLEKPKQNGLLNYISNIGSPGQTDWVV